MAQILDRLEHLKDRTGRTISSLFLELPDQTDYPDYYQLITSPVALDVIKERLETGEYNDEKLDKFGEDLRTMTANAKQYNREGSMVHRDATTLESYIDVAVKALTDDGSQESTLEQFSQGYCFKVLNIIKDHNDEEGRQLAELFLELPDEDEYPDYYEEILRPIAVEDIEKKIKKDEYPTLEAFEKDMNQMFDNAKQYNVEGSDVYADAEVLQRLFWTTIGDFVHLQNNSDPSKPLIALIYSLWEEKGQKSMDAVWFLRPEQIVRPYSSRFYADEVLKASGVHPHAISEVIERCFILQPRDYIRGRPAKWREGQKIYICEQRYNEADKLLTKLKTWIKVFPPGHKAEDLELIPYKEPLVLKKLPSASMMEKAGRVDTSEPPSRASTPQESSDDASSYGSSPSVTPAPTPKPAPKSAAAKATAPKTTKSNKRKSAQMQQDSTSASNDAQPKATAARFVNQNQQQQSREVQQPHHTTPATYQMLGSPTHQRYRCNYTNLTTNKQCATVFSNDKELMRHVAAEHASTVTNAPSMPALKRGRPKKLSETPGVDAVASPPAPTPTAAVPVQQNVAPLMSQSGYPPTAYNAYNPAQQYPSSTSSSSRGMQQQGMYPGGTYSAHPQQQQQQQQQSMYTVPPRSDPYQQQQYTAYQMQSGGAAGVGGARSQGYNANSYNQQGYGQPYSMQSQQHPGYPQQTYNTAQFQQQQGYGSHGGYAASQPYGQYPQQSYPGSSHQQYPYNNRGLPQPLASTPSPSAHSNLDPQSIQQQQQLAQQQRLAQQQQMVQQQYLAQQQQLAHQQIQQQQMNQQQQPQQYPGFHQRNLSTQSQTSQQGYPAISSPMSSSTITPATAASIMSTAAYAGQSQYATGQQQAYGGQVSAGYGHDTTGMNVSLGGSQGHGHSGHSYHQSTSSISSAGSNYGVVPSSSSVSSAMVPPSVEGVGLGLSGMSHTDHGRVVPVSNIATSATAQASVLADGSKDAVNPYLNTNMTKLPGTTAVADAAAASMWYATSSATSTPHDLVTPASSLSSLPNAMSKQQQSMDYNNNAVKRQRVDFGMGSMMHTPLDPSQLSGIGALAAAAPIAEGQGHTGSHSSMLDADGAAIGYKSKNGNGIGNGIGIGDSGTGRGHVTPIVLPGIDGMSSNHMNG
ncbi:hypothetical protein BGZ83_005250 [Gryganskiella cystojenkinii]|nr:hypothetical protein BGZ83_005250 [Gryganskiella cystojenkinii]